MASPSNTKKKLEELREQAQKLAKEREALEKEIAGGTAVSETRKQSPTVSGRLVDTNPQEIKGFLTKRGGIRKNWKKRWFQVEDGSLVYYHDGKIAQQRTKVLGRVHLKNATVLHVAEAKFKRPFCFGVNDTHTSRTFFMSASSKQEEDHWIDWLRHTVLKLDNRSGPSISVRPESQSTVSTASTVTTATSASSTSELINQVVHETPAQSDERSLAKFMANSLGVEHKGGVTGLVKKRNDISEEDRVFHQNKEANQNMAKMFGTMVMAATDGKKVKPSELAARKKGTDPKLQQAVEESRQKAAIKKRAEEEAAKQREAEEKAESLRKVDTIKQAIDAAKPKETLQSDIAPQTDIVPQSENAPLPAVKDELAANETSSEDKNPNDEKPEAAKPEAAKPEETTETTEFERKSDTDGDNQSGDPTLVNDEPASPHAKDHDSDDENDHLSEEEAKRILAMGALFKKLELLAYLKPFLVWQYDVESLKNITSDDLSTLISDRDARQRLVDYLASDAATNSSEE